MRFLLDEGVPISVGRVLEEAGHEVIYFNNSGIAHGAADPIVAASALSSGAVLVAADHDMKTLAKGRGISRSRFKSLGLVRFECEKPNAATRMAQAISLIEHENAQVGAGKSERLFVVIGKAAIRTYR